MKKGLLFSLLFCFALRAFSQQAEHVVLITIDGFRPDFYLDPSWNTPNLRELLKQGTHATGVTSVFPSMTYPSHTTIVTGVWPAKHGIYFNSMFEPNGPTGKIYWNDSAIKVPSLWTAAQKKGLKSAALFWPVSADAPVMYNIPDIGSMGESIREKYSRPQGIIAELKQNVFRDTARINYGKDQNVANIAAYVIKKDKPNLMTIHFFSVDHYEHEQGRQGPLVQKAVSDADSSVGIVINALKEAGIWEKTLFIVTGDHGFVDVTTSINPNVWLVKEGLITDVKKDEWKAQFFSVSGSSYLYLKDKKDTKTAGQVKAILDKLPAEEKKYIRFIDRKALDKVGGNPEVAFALSGENGASFGNGMSGEAVKPRKPGGAHGYYPDFAEIRTGFIAAGPGINKGAEIKQMSLKDLAPLIAKYLGLSLPTAEGKIPAGLLQR
jgi:predicted AlkP superfamily pyrophosphatase or phosphodiesterase